MRLNLSSIAQLWAEHITVFQKLMGYAKSSVEYFERHIAEYRQKVQDLIAILVDRKNWTIDISDENFARVTHEYHPAKSEYYDAYYDEVHFLGLVAWLDEHGYQYIKEEAASEEFVKDFMEKPFGASTEVTENG